MTDTLPPIASAPAGASAETLAVADAMFEKHGYTEDQRAAAGYRTTGSTKSAAPAALPFGTGGPRPAPAPEHAPPATQASHLSYETKIAAFKNLVGKVPDATIDAALKAEGLTSADIVTEAAPAKEQITVEQANERLALTSGPFAASQSPQEFQFNFQRDHIEGLDPSEVSDIHSMFADAFHGATIPVQLGQSVFSEAMIAANLYDGMDAATATLRYAEEGSKLRRMGNIEQIVADGEYAWSKLPKDFQEVAVEQRLFHTASAYHALANAGAVMRAREARAKK